MRNDAFSQRCAWSFVSCNQTPAIFMISHHYRSLNDRNGFFFCLPLKNIFSLIFRLNTFIRNWTRNNQAMINFSQEWLFCFFFLADGLMNKYKTIYNLYFTLALSLFLLSERSRKLAKNCMYLLIYKFIISFFFRSRKWENNEIQWFCLFRLCSRQRISYYYECRIIFGFNLVSFFLLFRYMVCFVQKNRLAVSNFWSHWKYWTFCEFSISKCLPFILLFTFDGFHTIRWSFFLSLSLSILRFGSWVVD